MLTIIALILAALLLVTFEILLPGGVLGVLAVGAVAAAVWFGYSDYGFLGGVTTLVISLTLITILVFVEFQLLPKTRFGRHLFLSKSSGGRLRYGSRTDEGAVEDLIGQQGEAATTMAPSGRVVIDGKTYEGYSQSGLLNKGAQVEVIARDAFRVVVKKIS